jgi:hypothetical protein
MTAGAEAAAETAEASGFFDTLIGTLDMAFHLQKQRPEGITDAG